MNAAGRCLLRHRPDPRLNQGHGNHQQGELPDHPQVDLALHRPNGVAQQPRDPQAQAIGGQQEQEPDGVRTNVGAREFPETR